MELSCYDGEDLVDTGSGFCCTRRLKKELEGLMGTEAQFVPCNEFTFMNPDNTVKPNGLWQLPVTAEAEGVDVHLRPVPTEDPCPDCGRRKFEIAPEFDGLQESVYAYWHPHFRDWQGDAAFWMVDQAYQYKGPIVTQAFIDAVTDFNLGSGVEIEEVKWAED